MTVFMKVIRFFLFLILIVGASAVSGYVAMKVVLGGGEVPANAGPNQPLFEALEIMGQSDLGLGIRGQEFDPVVAKHNVIRQDPPAGRRVKRGRRVSVILSKGPREARVPEVRGESWNRAVNILKAMGFKVGRVAWVESKSDHENTVIAQVPAPSRVVERGRQVSLLVSNGQPRSAFLMPDFVGKDLGVALRILRNSSLRVGKVVRADYPGVKVGVVLRHEPRGGSPIGKDDGVRLFVARGAGPGAKPTGTYAYFRYTLSKKIRESVVRVVLVHDQNAREIFNGKKKGGQEVGMLVRFSGKTVARIYLDGKLSEERVLQ